MECTSLYLDYQSTTPCDPAVLEAMMPYLTQNFGNPHARTHCHGWISEQAVEKAREQIARTLNADTREIIFTSGATESNNLALKGAAFYAQEQDPSKNHLITCQTEHKCILESCRFLQSKGFQITYLPVRKDGLIDLQDVEKAITPQTILVSIMGVNNEIGVIQPLQEIGALCQEKNILFHSDCAQAYGRIPLDVKKMNLALASITGHKIYGPKGVGALYVRRRPRVRLQPLFSGGGQERGLRSGTLPTFLCVGMGQAAQLASDLRETEQARLGQISKDFYADLQQALPKIYLNGSQTQRIADNLNISFAGVEGESLIMGLKEISLSSGSACTSESLETSYVLKALGVPEELSHTSLRISLGRYTTAQQAQEACQSIIQAVRRLREMSPLWDLLEQGVDLKTVQWVAH